jgi:hypothetical protein
MVKVTTVKVSVSTKGPIPLARVNKHPLLTVYHARPDTQPQHNAPGQAGQKQKNPPICGCLLVM